MTVQLTRRAFLERAVCAGALLAAARPAAAADGWFVSLNGSLTRGVGGADKIRLAAATGYGGVDWDLGPAKTAGRDATRSLNCANTGHFDRSIFTISNSVQRITANK